MPKKTKPEEAGKPTRAKEIKKGTEKPENGTWSEDQKKKSYYYDDDYGYEIYNPDEDDEAD